MSAKSKKSRCSASAIVPRAARLAFPLEVRVLDCDLEPELVLLELPADAPIVG